MKRYYMVHDPRPEGMVKYRLEVEMTNQDDCAAEVHKALRAAGSDPARVTACFRVP